MSASSAKCSTNCWMTKQASPLRPGFVDVRSHRPGDTVGGRVARASRQKPSCHRCSIGRSCPESSEGQEPTLAAEPRLRRCIRVLKELEQLNVGHPRRRIDDATTGKAFKELTLERHRVGVEAGVLSEIHALNSSKVLDPARTPSGRNLVLSVLALVDHEVSTDAVGNLDKMP